ncbi:hypothetical protein L2E82_45895 [Cichorium intybus]|uniref:Uncharacterized protein n=1 Tax=Cichorium intybus TaxID=13427 RepID=A0ACB8ZV97_CICIN|nr:hypothetical protein L2E82_45895 [Cichorium intybus]
MGWLPASLIPNKKTKFYQGALWNFPGDLESEDNCAKSKNVKDVKASQLLFCPRSTMFLRFAKYNFQQMEQLGSKKGFCFVAFRRGANNNVVITTETVNSEYLIKMSKLAAMTELEKTIDDNELEECDLIAWLRITGSILEEPTE